MLNTWQHGNLLFTCARIIRTLTLVYLFTHMAQGTALIFHYTIRYRFMAFGMMVLWCRCVAVRMMFMVVVVVVVVADDG